MTIYSRACQLAGSMRSAGARQCDVTPPPPTHTHSGSVLAEWWPACSTLGHHSASTDADSSRQSIHVDTIADTVNTVQRDNMIRSTVWWSHEAIDSDSCHSARGTPEVTAGKRPPHISPVDGIYWLEWKSRRCLHGNWTSDKISYSSPNDIVCIYYSGPNNSYCCNWPPLIQSHYASNVKWRNYSRQSRYTYPYWQQCTVHYYCIRTRNY